MAKIYNTRTCTHIYEDECKICDEYEKTKIYTGRTCTHTYEDECAICDEFERKVKSGELKGVYDAKTKITTFTTIIKKYLNS